MAQHSLHYSHKSVQFLCNTTLHHLVRNAVSSLPLSTFRTLCLRQHVSIRLHLTSTIIIFIRDSHQSRLLNLLRRISFITIFISSSIHSIVTKYQVRRLLCYFDNVRTVQRFAGFVVVFVFGSSTHSLNVL